MAMGTLNAFLCGRARCERREDFRSAVGFSQYHAPSSHSNSKQPGTPGHQEVCSQPPGSSPLQHLVQNGPVWSRRHMRLHVIVHPFPVVRMVEDIVVETGIGLVPGNQFTVRRKVGLVF